MTSQTSQINSDPSRFEQWERKPVPKPPTASSDSAAGKTEEPPLRDQWRELKSYFTIPINKHMPRHKRYCSLTRRAFLLSVAAISLILLALILGLSIGLTRGEGAKKLPLGSEHYTGDLTYYGTGLGACGHVSGDGDMVVSISHYVFDAVGKSRAAGGDPNGNALCGKRVRAVRDDGSGERSVDLRVVDRCKSFIYQDMVVSSAIGGANLARCGVQAYRHRCQSWRLQTTGRSCIGQGEGDMGVVGPRANPLTLIAFASILPFLDHPYAPSTAWPGYQSQNLHQLLA